MAVSACAHEVGETETIAVGVDDPVPGFKRYATEPVDEIREGVLHEGIAAARSGCCVTKRLDKYCREVSAGQLLEFLARHLSRGIL